MSLREPLNATPAADVEAGASTPAAVVPFTTKHARAILTTLTLLSTLLITALAALTYLLLTTPNNNNNTISTTPAHTTPPFLTTGQPQLTTPTPVSADEPPYIPSNQQLLARIAADMDASRNLSVDPCDDFYQYACGGWISSTTIPPGGSQVTKGFDIAGRENNRYIEEVILADWPIVTPFYESCINTAAVDALGATPVQRFMHDLEPTNVTQAGWTKSDVFDAMGRLRRVMGVTQLFDLLPSWEYGRYDLADNPRLGYLLLYVGGFTVDEPTYYYGTRNISARITAGVRAVLQAAGDSASNAALYAQLVVDFETKMWRAVQNQLNDEEMSEKDIQESLTVEQRLAKIMEAREQENAQNLGNLGVVANNITFDRWAAAMPNTPLWAYLNATGLTDTFQRANMQGWVALPSAAYLSTLSRLDRVIANASVTQLAAYTRWRALNESMPYLSTSIRLAHQQHFGAIKGVENPMALPDRYPQCSQAVVYNLADLFGRYFMARRLAPEMRDQARSLITWIRQAFQRNLPDVDWMDEQTRVVALQKAYAMLELVGGPENGNWSDYSEVMIRRDRYYDNWFQLQGLRTAEAWAQLTQPLTRGRFGMNPSIVNAQYNSVQNSMIFPAGILVSPFFNYDYPMAMNLGGIGMVMGHEMLHGFDNNGRRFDKDGYLRQWWSTNVETAFTRKTQCLINQYNNIKVQGYNIRGSQTLGENIADNGGIHMAYLALQWYKSQLAAYNLTDPTPPSKAPLTTDQLFYYAHAQTWCTKATNAAIQYQVLTGVHSPGEARVWAPLVNQPSEHFAKAFNCPVGSRMNPPADKKCDLY